MVAKDSPNKRLDPDSPEGKAELRALVDAACGEFVSDVAAHRGVSEADVLERFGQGLVFDGNEAVSRGMADARGTFDSIIAGMADRDVVKAVPAPAAIKETPMDWDSLTMAQLREHRADLVSEIEEGAKSAAAAKAETDRKEAVAEAVAAERTRAAEIDEVSVEGYEDLTAKAKSEGWSAGKLATEILKADKAAGASHIATRKADDTAAAVAPAEPPSETVAASDDSIEDAARATWDKDKSLRAEFGDFETYLAYAKAENAGRARVLKRSAA